VAADSYLKGIYNPLANLNGEEYTCYLVIETNTQKNILINPLLQKNFRIGEYKSCQVPI
jgi:hypothetical protein